MTHYLICRPRRKREKYSIISWPFPWCISTMNIIVKFQKEHFMFIIRTVQWIIFKRRKDSSPPSVETAKYMAFFFWNCQVKIFIYFAVSGIKPAIADHFKVLFRDMPDQTFDEIHCGNGFLDVFIIFMTVVMKCNGAGILIIAVNSGCGNDWAPKITSDVFCDCFRVAFVWFCINIKSIFMVCIALGFYFLKDDPSLRSISSSSVVRKAFDFFIVVSKDSL